MSDEPALTARDFEIELQRLREAAQKRVENERCLACEGCERSVDCTFCKASRELARCHYCVDCERCRDSSHCTASKDLAQCMHCLACERCTASSYVVRSVDCTGCAYCFGCVGLVKKDFHVLNRPYERSAYFAITARLSRELGLTRRG